MCAPLAILMLIGIGNDGSVKSIGWLLMVSICLLLLLGIFYPFLLTDSQEYIFYEVYRKLGLSHEGIMNHFTGLHFQV